MEVGWINLIIWLYGGKCVSGSQVNASKYQQTGAQISSALVSSRVMSSTARKIKAEADESRLD